MPIYWGVKRSAQVDFDYDYYANTLKSQYPPDLYNYNKPLPFECSGGDCISGLCDLTHTSAPSATS